LFSSFIRCRNCHLQIIRKFIQNSKANADFLYNTVFEGKDYYKNSIKQAEADIEKLTKKISGTWGELTNIH